MKELLRSEKLEHVHSDIRGPLYVESLKMAAAGKSVLRLNTGNPATFGFKMPDSVRNALLDNVDKAVAYCDLKGMPDARKAICEYELSKGIQGITPDDVYIGNGVSELVTMVLTAFLNYNDEFLVPSPSYSLWTNSVYIAGAKPVFYTLNEENNWYPDANEIETKITSKTRGILLINPNNPTGAVYPKEVLEDIIKVAKKHDLVIFSDEIYDRLLMDGVEHVSVASLCPDWPVVTLNGLSKSHVICGFRCGWMVFSGPKHYMADVVDGVFAMASMRLCSNALTQLVIPAALQDHLSTQEMVNGRLKEQRDVVCEVLDQIDGISYVKNKAAFYLFPKLDKEKFGITDDKKFAMDLLHQKQILIVPSSGFDWNGNDHFRIVMLPEKDVLRKAMEDLGDFLSTYKQN